MDELQQFLDVPLVLIERADHVIIRPAGERFFKSLDVEFYPAAFRPDDAGFGFYIFLCQAKAFIVADTVADDQLVIRTRIVPADGTQAAIGTRPFGRSP